MRDVRAMLESVLAPSTGAPRGWSKAIEDEQKELERWRRRAMDIDEQGDRKMRSHLFGLKSIGSINEVEWKLLETPLPPDGLDGVKTTALRRLSDRLRGPR